MKDRYLRTVKKVVLYLVMIVIACLFILPFVQIVGTSLKTYKETLLSPPAILPEVPQWSNYLYVFNHKETIPLGLWIRNSLFTTGLIVLGLMLSCSFIGYGFARFNGPGKNFWFFAIIGTMLVPVYCILIPLYRIFAFIHWRGTFLPMIVQPFFGQAMYLFLFRQFIMSIPRDVDEAAIIDGASYFTIFARIIVPMIRPVMAAVGILTFIAAWNDFVTPLVFLTNIKLYTLPIGEALMNATNGSAGTDTQYIACVALIAAVPSFVIYFSAQKYFVGGIAAGAVKG